MPTVWFLIAALIAVVLGVPAVTAQAPGFSFSPNQRLIEPTNPLNSLLLSTNFDTEPGIKIDSADNVYVGAIHGVPGGTVMWKAPAGSCTNSGCTFRFLGEVDSAQKAQEKRRPQRCQKTCGIAHHKYEEDDEMPSVLSQMVCSEKRPDQ